MQRFALLLTAMLASPFEPRAESLLHDFVRARGDQLMEGDHAFRFISWNIPNLLLIEDNVPFAEENPWRLPDRFEIADAFESVRQMGGTVARTYVISVLRTNDAPGTPRHVLGPGRFNEEAFRSFDEVLQTANATGIRLIIPLVDNWSWMGGRAEYARFRGKSKDAFWTDPQIIADFKQTIAFILNRTNTFTGVRYRDDKAILCWETGNELAAPAAWTREIAAFIKSCDTNHLVMDGVNAARLHDESLAMPETDLVTTHHYPGIKRPFAELIRENWEKAKGKKPYVIGEFGFVNTRQMAAALEAIKDTGVAGGLLWSLRFHNRDGGFYWHSEPHGGNQYKAFHWPGSTLDAPYDEIDLMALVRKNAYAIRGMAAPPVPVPAPPKLLQLTDPAAISWQGSAGASSYIVERAPKATGPWTIAGADIDESFVQYRPLFADEGASRNPSCYRVRAINRSGVSEPSNVAGPVAATHATLVDELADFSKVYAREGGFEIKSRDCRQVKEDAHRAGGKAGGALIYRLPTTMEGFCVFVFFPGEVSDPVFAISDDGRTYRVVATTRESHYQGAGDYGYWRPVRYQDQGIQPGGKFLKIGLTGETQIGRVQIIHALPER